MTERPEQLAFDVPGAELAREAGQDLAYGADRVQEWKVAAAVWLRGRGRGEAFTADDLVRSIGLPDEGVNQNNVVGAWFAAMSKAGRIEWTGRYAPSRRVIRHRNLQRVWAAV